MRYFLIIAILTLTTSLLAQKKREFGFRFGGNLQDFQCENFDGNQIYDDIKSGDRELGFHMGFYGNIKVAFLRLQPEITLTQIYNELTVESDSGPEQIYINYNRLDFPLLAGLKLGPLRAYAGPVVSFNMEEQSNVLQTGLRGGTWGYQYGGGLNLGKRLRVDVRYEGAWSNTADVVTIAEQDFETDARVNQLIIGMGFRLF